MFWSDLKLDLKLRHHSEHYWKKKPFLICKTTVRRYWKVENFDYVRSNSKNFRSKSNIKIKNRCNLGRIRSTPRTKPLIVRKPTMAPNRIFVLCCTRLRETICQNWKSDSIYSFWSRTFQEYLYRHKFTIINDTNR